MTQSLLKMLISMGALLIDEVKHMMATKGVPNKKLVILVQFIVIVVLICMLK